MKPVSITTLATALSLACQSGNAAPLSVWDATQSPALPLRYIERSPNLRLTPQIANAETYAPKALSQRLYPSISVSEVAALPTETTIEPTKTSKTRETEVNQPRGILSSSYVQEFAYIDTYSNIRKYEENFNFPSIHMSLALPRFGNGFGGGYQPLQFGFGPAAFRFW